MTDLLSYILQGAALGLTAAASPGLLQAFLITQTLEGGWKRGAWVPLSPFISDPPIVITILLLLNQLPARFIDIISLVGGLFVIYLAWGMWRQWRKGMENQDTQPYNPTDILQSNPFTKPTPWRILGKGALMNLLSPGPYTFWTFVVGPMLLEMLKQSTWYGVGFLVGFYSLFVGGMLGIVGVFHQARRLGGRVVRTLLLLSILILFVLGLSLIGRNIHWHW